MVRQEDRDVVAPREAPLVPQLGELVRALVELPVGERVAAARHDDGGWSGRSRANVPG
jgi:hypothetical protein